MIIIRWTLLLVSFTLIIVVAAFLFIQTPDTLETKFNEVNQLFPLLPTYGLEGTIATKIIPSDILGGETNALDAAEVSFIDNETHLSRAGIFIMKTLNKTYEHDYSICGRFHGYTLESASVIPLPINSTHVTWFWYVPLIKKDEPNRALIFSIFVDENNSSFVVDSRWIHDNYPNPIDDKYQYILTVEIWAYTYEDAYKLLQQTLNNLERYGKVSYANTIKPSIPQVFIKSIEYSDNKILLNVQSFENMRVQFDVGMRQRNNREYAFSFERNETLSIGSNNIEIPAPDMQDAVVSLKTDDLVDKAYVGTGFWFSFGDPQTTVNLILRNDTQFKGLGNGGLAFASSAEMVGITRSPGGYAALGYALGPHGKPSDVRQYKSLTFYARGNDRQYDVLITSDSITDFDYHRFTFTAPREGRQFSIPISSFKQKGFGIPVKFSGNDVRTIAWASVNATPGQTFSLFIGNASFII